MGNNYYRIRYILLLFSIKIQDEPVCNYLVSFLKPFLGCFVSRHPPQEADSTFISQANLPESWGKTCFDMKLNQHFTEIMKMESWLNITKLYLSESFTKCYLPVDMFKSILVEIGFIVVLQNKQKQQHFYTRTVILCLRISKYIASVEKMDFMVVCMLVCANFICCVLCTGEWGCLIAWKSCRLLFRQSVTLSSIINTVMQIHSLLLFFFVFLSHFLGRKV